jgi:hypothetical protein
MKTTLTTPGAYDDIVQRFRSLQPDAARQWGRMSVDGMFCHLHDSYTVALQPDWVDPTKVPWVGRVVVKWIGLYSPLPWMKGTPTMPEVDQDKQGTRPTGFEADRERMLASLQRFATTTDFSRCAHPFFGTMTHWEWMRWGWFHADHHLRQFNA